MAEDTEYTADETVDTDAAAADGKTVQQTEPEDALVKRIQKTIKADKAHHKPAFDRMREDMFLARTGRQAVDPVDHYKVALAGRHVKQKTAALYAKNPKAAARRRETIDFVLWDEDPKSLELAMQTVMMASQAMAAAAPVGPPQIDPMTGQPIEAPQPQIPPEMAQAFEAANATVADFKQGMEKRAFVKKIGKTLEILFSQALREQKPVDFKTGMKQAVRRACTTAVAYVELGFQREYGPRPAMMEKLADYRARLDHLRVLTEKVTEDRIEPDDPEIAELQQAIAALQAEPEIVVREGLIIDFPQATKVIPDKLCRNLVGFIGARHVTLEYMYTCDQVREIFGVDLGRKYTGYTPDGKAPGEKSAVMVNDSEEKPFAPAEKGSGLVCVWKHYDKASGLVHYVADGHDKFLRASASPDVFVEDFWPVYALTFNDVESEDELFPPSDVRLMTDSNLEHNRSRQGLREHRHAARPRWGYQNGTIEEEDVKKLTALEPFQATGFNLQPGQKLSDVLEAIPVPGVDPNLYETNQFFTDTQMAVGSSESQFGMTGKATATGEAIAAGASKSADDSSIDDLDSFLTVIARASGQILLKEMSEEQVKAVAGVGAVWPQMSLADIAGEIFLEVEAGSTGKPNQAMEIANWEKMMPFLIQLPDLDPAWLARETVRRLDDKADLTEALSKGTMSVVAANGMALASANAAPAAQPGTGDPATDPASQGPEGASNAPQPGSQQAGSGPAMGNNQV